MTGASPLTCAEVRDLAPGFALGSLEPDEAEAVRAHLAECSDAHAEIAELASGLPALWETLTLVDPPASLKARLLAAAARDAVVPAGTAAALEPEPAERTPTPIAEHPGRPGRARTRPGGTSSLQWLVGLAAVLAIVLFGAWNLVLQGQVGTLRTHEDSLAAVVKAATLPGSLTAVVAATQPGGPTGLAALTADGHLVLAMRDLPRTAGSQVYQAWVIVPGSAPAPTGSFVVDEAGAGSITTAPAPAAPGAVVAITLEPGPGATIPTLPILASGTTPTRTN